MKNNTHFEAPNVLDARKNVLYQVSLLQGLSYGDYYGSVTIGELKQHGSAGLGTFNRLNGELIMLDGNVYRAAGDGSIEAVSDEETTPFAVAAFMAADETRHLAEIQDVDVLYHELDRMVEARGKNRFHMSRIDGLFQHISVRSVYAQKEPYQRLVEVLEHDQTFFDYENIKGTMVGLYCPSYMSALNAAGWHWHFISEDKTQGGHVLGVQIADAVLTWADIDAFELKLPHNAMFAGFDFTVDQSKDIEKIEKSVHNAKTENEHDVG